MDLICSSLMANDVEHFLCVYQPFDSLENCLFNSLLFFKLDYLSFLLLSCKSIYRTLKASE